MKVTVIAQYSPDACYKRPRLWADLLEDWTYLPVKVPHDYRIEKYMLSDPPEMAMDTETDGAGGLGQWSVAYRKGENNQLTVTPFFGPQRGFSWDCPVIMHNAKYDLRELKKNKMQLPSDFHDTMVAGFCMGLGKQAPADDGKKKSGSDMVGGLGLKYLARRQLGMEMKYTWQDMKDHPERVPEYNANDSVATLLLWEKWKPLLPAHYWEVDKPLLPVLMEMEDKGIKIDPEYLTEFGNELDVQLKAIHLNINPNSPKQIGEYLYGEKSRLKLTPWKFTDTGQPSTDEETLSQINDSEINNILKYRELAKEKGTYVDNYYHAMDSEDRIHAEIKQTSTKTARLSIARPSLQNVNKEGNLRKLFVAKPGYKLVRGDFNQLDFRTLAAITQDPILFSALKAGKKIHQVTQEELGIEYKMAKIANFSVMFGAEAWTLASELGITIDEATNFIERYFKKFPGIKKYQDDMAEIIRRDKKVTIPFENRVRRIDAMYVENKRIQKEGIKEGTNLPVQGLEAYVCKKVMLDLHYKHHAPMLLQVHDEIIFEIENSQAVAYAHWLKEYVPTIIELGGMNFPFETSYGDSWKEQIDI